MVLRTQYHALLTLNYQVIILVLVKCRHIRTLRQLFIIHVTAVASVQFFFVSFVVVARSAHLSPHFILVRFKVKRINYSMMTFQGCYFFALTLSCVCKLRRKKIHFRDKDILKREKKKSYKDDDWPLKILFCWNSSYFQSLMWFRPFLNWSLGRCYFF